ncbi:hypothetical protein FRC10_002367 [Ceratobasidium sp. 414]|nr:hypothetical protein FRC10_002367 [Ceratobasidium sp. 414]
MHCKKPTAQGGSNKTGRTSTLHEKIAAGITNPKLALSTQHHVNLLHMILLLVSHSTVKFLMPDVLFPTKRLFSTVNTWSKTYTDQINTPVFMVYGSTFQCHYVPNLYSSGHMNQRKVLYHPTGMKSTHHGLLTATAGFQPSSNGYMDTLCKFVHTFNLPETVLAFKAASDALKGWVGKGERLAEVRNLASLVEASKVVAFPIPALWGVMSKEELLDLEKQLTKEMGPKFSTVLDLGYLDSIQMSSIVFPSNKTGKDLSFRAWRQCTGWVIHNHKFLEDVQEALNNWPSITRLFKLAAGHILQCKGAKLNHTSLWFSDCTLVFPECDGEEEDLEGQTPMDMDKDEDKDEDKDDLDQLVATSPEAPAPAKDKGKGKEKEQAGRSSNPKATVKSCEIIGANLDLQMDMEYKEEARAAQASTTAPAPLALPQQRPAPCPAWAKILTSALYIEARAEFVADTQAGERLAAEDIYELNLELVELDAKFLKEWQFAKEDIVQHVKVVRHTVKVGADIATGLAEVLAKSHMGVSMVVGAGGLLTQAVCSGMMTELTRRLLKIDGVTAAMANMEAMHILRSMGMFKDNLFELTEEDGAPVLTLAGWTYQAFDSEHEGEVGLTYNMRPKQDGY